MTAKEIYEKIDLAKLPKGTADKLRTLEKKTKGFTIKSDKIDAALKQTYDRLKERMPEALKDLKVEMETVEKKVETKAGEKTAKVKIPKVKGKKKVSKKTPTPSAPKKRRTVATLASEIRKANEDWQDALARAGKIMKEETKKAEASTKKELDKLRDMLKSDPAFSGYPRTYGKQSKNIDVSKDAKTKALPAGKRVSKKGVKNQYGTSKGGRTYWENRDNRSDRMSPNYPTKVYLEYGGSLATQPYWLADNPDALVSTETMGEMFEVGGEVFVPTEQLADNPNALVSTTTYAELFKKGGKVSGEKRTFDVVFQKERHGKVVFEKKISGRSFANIKSQAIKIAKDKGYGLASFYVTISQRFYDDEPSRKVKAYVGYVDKDDNWAFTEGVSAHKSPLSTENVNRVEEEFYFAQGGKLDITDMFEKGGRLGFDGLAKKVAKNYQGKKVAPKYQEEYGKRYSKEEALEVGRKVAAKIYGIQQSKK